MYISSINHTSFIARIQIIFDFCIRFLLIFLPFSAFSSVFLTYVLEIPGAAFIKEGMLCIAAVTLGILLFLSPDRKKLRFSQWEYLIGIYILLFVGVSIFTTGLRGIIFGGRFDFMFLIAFLIVYRGYAFLEKPLSYYLRLFLYSGGLMLFLSAALKWPLSEDLLVFFGYSGNPSVWDFGGAPPIFHGVDGANVRRFQGILDNPNTMGAFLILFGGIFAYFHRFRQQWYFVISLILIGLFALVFYTYSRSALIAAILAVVLMVFSSLRALFFLYRTQLIVVLILLMGSVSVIGFTYSESMNALLDRAASTQGHAERMIIGVNRVMDHPLGQGLGSAGPGYRYVQGLDGVDHQSVADADRYYIPESWYIQQFIEGGIIGGILFLIVMMFFFARAYRIHPLIGAVFLGIGVMNLFLHIFESSVVSLLLFMILGLLFAQSDTHKKITSPA